LNCPWRGCPLIGPVAHRELQRYGRCYEPCLFQRAASLDNYHRVFYFCCFRTLKVWTVKTYIYRKGDVKSKWYVIDAEDQIRGRLATRAATLLRGKHRPDFTPFLDLGDHVVVVNAAKIRLTGNKLDQKIYRHYTGYPGGLREAALRRLLD